MNLDKYIEMKKTAQSHIDELYELLLKYNREPRPTTMFEHNLLVDFMDRTDKLAKVAFVFFEATPEPDSCWVKFKKYIKRIFVGN